MRALRTLLNSKRIISAVAGVAVAGLLLSSISNADSSSASGDKDTKAKEEKSAANKLPSAAKPKATASDDMQKSKLRSNSYYYSAFNKRDPFASLIVGDFISEKKMTPVDVNQVELVGVINGDLDRFALLEDRKGFSYVLRVGDKVRNGSVVAIGEETLVARVTNFGQSRKLTLRLAQREKGVQK